MEQGEPVPIFDFPVLSDERVPAGRTLEDAGPGDQIVYEEKVWRLGEERQPGDFLGVVTLVETVTNRPGRRPFSATFDLEGFDDAIEVSGMVPGNGTWIGRGVGNGRGGGRTGRVPIEGWNPKSWG
jgi:hypothetical protein